MLTLIQHASVSFIAIFALVHVGPNDLDLSLTKPDPSILIDIAIDLVNIIHFNVGSSLVLVLCLCLRLRRISLCIRKSLS